MRSLWLLRGFFKPLTKIIVGLALVGGTAAFLNTAVFQKLKPLLQNILETLPPADDIAGRAARMNDLYSIAGMLLATLAVAALADGAALYLGEMLGQRLLMSLREKVFSHLQSLSMSFFDNRRSGELISRVSNDTQVLQMNVGSNLHQLFVAPATAIGLMIYMVSLSWRLTLVIFCAIPVIVLITSQLGRRVRRYSTRVQAKFADLTSALQESFVAMRVIKIFGMEPRIVARFQSESLGMYRAIMRAARMHALNMPAVGSLVGVALCTSLLYGAHQIFVGRLTGGELLTFVFAMYAASSQINRVSRVFLSLQQAEAAAARILNLLEETPEIDDAPNAVGLEHIAGRITLQNVSFSYDGDHPVINDVSLDIEPGEVVALAGPSGSGKTTIANLVARLYEVNGGAVLVDGTDVRDISQHSLRSRMGIVPQETILFGASIAENIGYGRPEASFEEIQAAARAANADGFINELPEGYETLVGERGTKLSGGQRQRIAIARAFLRDPRILILDEATSSLDRESEAAVHRALTTLLEGRTALIIAHRLSTIRNADRIVVLERGRIAEQGTHDKLLAQDGLYKRLYETLGQAEEGHPL